MQETKIYLQTGYLLDISFERVLENQSTIAEVLPDFQSAWDRVGPQLLCATIKEIGKPFLRRELLAYLIMHPTVFSCSHPFLININKLLKLERSSSEWERKLIDVVFHEALHIFLDDNYLQILDENSPAASPLIRKYLALGSHVTAHTHLYAIQKRIYLSCGLASMWDQVCKDVATAHNDGYRIAIEAVNEVGYQPFLDELK